MRNVIVTGGTRGLGLAIARRLRTAGYCVVAVARHQGESFAAAVKEGGALHFRSFDLSDIAGIPGLVRGLRKEFGPIYGLVNNAAIGSSGILATMRDQEIEETVRLNILSPLVVSKYAVRSMMAGEGGRIVNITSIAGFSGYSGLAAYGASKASLIGFTRSLAREVGLAGINVNAVAPGFVDTDMTHGLDAEHREQVVRRSALRRLAGTDDIADAVEFLMGDKARNITGTVLTVDAGSTA
ncbi:MAG TPA: SDR family NAD(P)-dependent oxidoreductase [Stellaceae bacterium]|nr:SDR family NAD(P)-dependent oxidoreductase [Stellaceae bacterium]